MRKFNIQIKPIHSKSNKLQGFRYIFNNSSLKGSEVHRSLSINKLNSKFKENC